MKSLFFSSILLCLCLLLSDQLSAFNKDISTDATFPFIENKGQVVDQNGMARTDVLFIYEHDGFKLVLRNTGFSYEFTKVIPVNGETESGELPQTLEEAEDVVIPDVKYASNRIDIEFQNCNRNAIVAGEEISSFYRNYFNQHTGPSGITGIHSFSKVIYKNIYAGIDLVFFTSQRADGKVFPEYEFIVSSEGKPEEISLAYSGMEKIGVLPDGSLQVNSDLGYVHETCPVILNTDRNFLSACAYSRNGASLSFQNIKRKKDQPIIIDPAIEWGTYYGGTGKDIPDELASDSHQNIYLTGGTRSISMIATAGAQKTTYSGGDDAVLIKFDTNGNLLWATYHGGSGNDVAFAITTDLSDNIFIGGRTISPDGIATPGAVIDTVSGGLFDVFIAKFNPDGVLQWGTYMGADLKDEVQGMATNPAGDLYVSGYSESLTGISTTGIYKSVGDTAGESFLMKFSPEGHQLWGTYYGGKGRDRGHGVWVNNGHVYQAGTTNSKTGIATTGSFQDHYTKLLDAFLAEWTEDGQLVWGTYIGGEGDDRPRDVRTDNAGSIYVVGQTESETKIATTGTWKTVLHYNPGTNRDAFIEKFTPEGTRIWGTYFGGNFIEMPRSLRVNPSGAPIWIGGYTKSDSGLATKNGYQDKIGGFNDGFIAKFNWDGSQLMYASYYGGSKSESITEGGWYGSPMDMDVAGNIYLASCTQSNDSIATPGGYKLELADSGQYDYFIVKFSDVCSDPFEPNDSTTGAVPTIPFNKSLSFNVKAQIQKKNDKDYFIINVDGDFQFLNLHLTDLPIDCNLFLYDASLNLLAKSQNTGLAAENILLDYASPGKYYVLVKNPLGSVFDAGNCYTFSGETGPISTRASLPGDIGDSDVLLYPNPAEDHCQLSFTAAETGVCRISITDLTGHEIGLLDATLVAGDNIIMLPVEDLAAGNYLVKLISGTGVQTAKLLIER
jgi:hypothetical protein